MLFSQLMTLKNWCCLDASQGCGQMNCRVTQINWNPAILQAPMRWNSSHPTPPPLPESQMMCLPMIMTKICLNMTGFGGRSLYSSWNQGADKPASLNILKHLCLSSHAQVAYYRHLPWLRFEQVLLFSERSSVNTSSPLLGQEGGGGISPASKI